MTPPDATLPVELSDAEVDAFLARELTDAARTDVNAFCTMVLRDERTGLPLAQAPVHESWHDLADRHDRLLLWAAIEHGKTWQMSIARPLHELGKDPSLRVVVCGRTQQQAQKAVRACKNLVESSAELHAVFPHLRPSEDHWSASSFTVRRKVVSRDPSMQAVGLGGNIRGSRIDLLILDDVLDVENTRTRAGRDQVHELIQSKLFSRLTANARVLVIGTAFHPDDALHRLAKAPGFAAYRYPVLDEAGQPRWPERWPLARVAKTKELLGPLEAARQLFCQARSDEDSRFKWEWLARCLARGDGKQLCHSLQAVPPGFKTYTGVDLAVGRGQANDLTCLFDVAVHPDGTREVLNLEAGRWSGPDIVTRIIDHHRRYNSVCVVENNACFPPGTRVLTRAGYRSIEAVRVGDEVWTHAGRWRRVLDTLVGTSKTLVTARACGCLPVRATPNHWFYLRRAGRVPGGRNVPDVGKHRPVGAPRWVSYGFRDEAAYAAVAVPRWPDKAPILRLRKTTRQPARDVAVDEELALVLGLYMAEGHSTKGQACWTLNQREVYLADFVSRVVRERFPASVRRSFNSNGALRVVASCTQLAEALRFGAGAAKCPPWEWMGWPRHLRLALVRGWLLGDGTAMVNNGKTRWPVWHLSGASISRDWVGWARATLHQAGITTALRVGDSRKTDVIEGRTVTRQPIYTLALTRDGSRTLREAMSSPTEARHWRKWWAADSQEALHRSKPSLVLEDGAGWSRVPEIEEAPYEAWGGPVHNLVVEEDESFTVEDFVVHNAQDFIVQFARGAFAVPIRPFTTGRNKAHPEFGVESMAAEMAGGKWVIPSRGGQPAHPELHEWLQEMLYYSPPPAHTGDRLMASWFAREGARMGAITVAAHTVDVLAR